MTLGALDLSIVTARVIDELDAAKAQTQIWAANPADRFDIDFSGEHPHQPRKDTECRVSLYLFHVNPDPTHRNSFPLGGPARTVPEHPLGLTLHYLLSAQADSFVYEQQAMSVALKCLHEHPVMTAAVPLESHVERFTVTMEPQTTDEVGRLWLAMATPLQLSAVYRAEVVFLAPEPSEPGEIVVEPELDVFSTSSPLPSATAGPTLASAPTRTGTVVVTGAGFDAATIELEIRGLRFAVVPGPPLAPRQACVISPTELQLRLPPRTPRGQYPLRVTLAPRQPTWEVTIIVERDVP